MEHLSITLTRQQYCQFRATSKLDIEGNENGGAIPSCDSIEVFGTSQLKVGRFKFLAKLNFSFAMFQTPLMRM